MKKNIIKESLNNFYSEEDSNGKIGQVGQVKSYDCGYMTEPNVEVDAKESGYQSIEEYLKRWWNEVSAEIPFTWETLGKGYGYHGNDIFTQVEPDGGILHCKEIFGQIMFDVYPPQQNESNTKNIMKKNTVKINESTLRKIVAESVKKVVNEAHANCGLNSHYMDLFRNRIENAIRTNGDIKKEASQFYYDFKKVIMNKNFTLNNLVILAKDIENGTTSGTNITPGASRFPSTPYFGHKEDFYESKLNRIVAESVKKVLKESFAGADNEFDDNVAQKAKSGDDVFKLNYWKYRFISKDEDNGEYVLRCYTNNNSMETRNYPDFEKVVDDLNKYYKLHGYKYIVQALPNFLLKITTKV